MVGEVLFVSIGDICIKKVSGFEQQIFEKIEK
jgi:hypothetical protein